MDITVRGAEKLAKLAGAVQQYAPELRKELLREIRTGVRPLLPKIRNEATETLPSRGGLAGIVADAQYVVRTRTSGKQVGVRVEGRLPGHDLRSIDRGNLRHPVFARAGRRRTWVGQRVAQGFFSRPANYAKPDLQGAVIEAMEKVATTIERKAT